MRIILALGNKLSRLRKENNYTQEQLAEILGVSRQSISKWESDISYPETDKLIHLSNLFGYSLDYLLKENDESNDYGKKTDFDNSDSNYANSGSNYSDAYSNAYYAKTDYSDSEYSYGKSKKYSQLDVLDSGLNIVKEHLRERKSKKTFCGLPLWHIGRNAKGIIAIGLNAKGFLAIGKTKATGSVFEKIGSLSKEDVANVKHLLDVNVPEYLAWAKNIVKAFL